MCVHFCVLCMCESTSTYMCVYMCVHVCMCACVSICMCVRVCTCFANRYMCLFVGVSVFTYTCVYMCVMCVSMFMPVHASCIIDLLCTHACVLCDVHGSCVLCICICGYYMYTVSASLGVLQYVLH